MADAEKSEVHFREIDGHTVPISGPEPSSKEKAATRSRSTIHHKDGTKKTYTVRPHTNSFSGQRQGYELKVDAPAGSGESGKSVFDTRDAALAAKARHVEYDEERARRGDNYSRTTHSKGTTDKRGRMAMGRRDPDDGPRPTLYQWKDVDLAGFQMARAGRPQRGGQPVHRYWKEMARVGEVTDSKGRRQTVTMSRLKGIHDDTKALMAKGYEPYLPLGTHTAGKGKSVGFVVDLKLEPDGSLHGLHEFVGFTDDEVRKLVARQKSSLGTIADLTDVDGVTYAEVLDHNAIIPDPQFNDLGPFIPAGHADFQPALAASRGLSVEAVTLQFARGDTHTEQPMPHALTADQVGKIEKLIPDRGTKAEAITDENAVDELIAYCGRLHAKPGVQMSREDLDAARQVTGLAELSAEDAAPTLVRHAKTAAAEKLQLSRDLKAAEKAKADAEGRTLELSRNNKAPAAPTARELNYAGIAVRAAKQQALASHAITPFVAEQAEAKFLKRPLDFSTLTMSREPQAADAGLLEGMDNLVLFYEAVQGNAAANVNEGESVDDSAVLLMGRSAQPGRDPAKQKHLEKQWDAEDEADKARRLAERGIAV